MPKQLSEQQIDTYRRDGGLFPIAVMSEAEAAEHRRRLEAAETAHRCTISTRCVLTI